MITFLEQGYKPPRASGGYMKLEDGDNKFRILSQSLIGWEDWEDKKPMRYSYNEKPSKSIDPNKPIKHFWAFIVWNYAEEQIQILEITQATIRNFVGGLCKDEEWGDPFHYDIKVTKKGEGVKTEYLITPCNAKPISDAIKLKFLEKPICLDAMIHGEDPFNCPPKLRTLGFFEYSANISPEQLVELTNVIGDDIDYTERLLRNYNIHSLKYLSVDKFDLVLDKAKAYKELE